LAVLLAACCYGRSAGFVVALGATALDGLLNWTALSEHVDFYDFLIANSWNAVLWLAAAAVFGRIQERQFERRREAEEARDQRTEEARTLAERCRALARATTDLERRIAASGASAAGSILEVFQKVARLSGPRSLDAYRKSLNLLIGAERVDIYVPSEEGWARLPGPDEPGSRPVPNELCDIVASSDGVLSALRSSDAKLLDGNAAMAACVRDKDGKPLGVAFIGEIDPSCMTAAGEAALSLSNFILANRYLEPEFPLLDDRFAQHPKIQLKVVNGEIVSSQP
jgi:hypothetical protein